MISEELRSRMRRLFFAEHWKVGTIASELGVHHDVVERAIEPKRFVNVVYRPSASILSERARARRQFARGSVRVLHGGLLSMPTLRQWTGVLLEGLSRGAAGHHAP